MATSRIPRITLDDIGTLAPRTPGPLGHNGAASPHGRRIHAPGDTPGPLGINDGGDPRQKIKVSAVKTWDPQAAASYLKNPHNGWAGVDSKGRCARAVRLAIIAGHTATPNNPVSAVDYKDYLPKLGFHFVTLEGYSPRIGDVAVFPAVPKLGHPHGHIEMYTGEGWQSDYVQKEKSSDGRYGRGFFANNIWVSRPFAILRKEMK